MGRVSNEVRHTDWHRREEIHLRFEWRKSTLEKENEVACHESQTTLESLRMDPICRMVIGPATQTMNYQVHLSAMRVPCEAVNSVCLLSTPRPQHWSKVEDLFKWLLCPFTTNKLHTQDSKDQKPLPLPLPFSRCSLRFS